MTTERSQRAWQLKAQALRAENRRLRKVLRFYADPDTYFAVGVVGDPPCGDFVTDFEAVDGAVRPGKRARAALARRRVP